MFKRIHYSQLDVFKNFQNMCCEIYGLDPAYIFSAPGLACQAALKNSTVKLDLLKDIDMLLLVEKGIGGSEYVILFIDM